MNHLSADNPKALQTLFLKALEAHRNGDIVAAESYYHHLIKLIPEFWQLYYNLGLLLFDTHRYEEALEIYREGVDLPEADNDLLFNLAICQKKLGLFEEALSSYNQALTVDPNDLDCHYNRGGCLMALERYEEAISAYQEVLLREPDHLSARLNQAYLLHRTGEIVSAIAGYRKVLERDPGHQSAGYMLAALTGDSRTCAPHSYIRDVFNQFSAHYEKRVVGSLSYRLPERLLKIVMRENHGDQFLSLLDLGCGTGLIGRQCRRIAEIMHGVDLSEKMIEKARQKGLYDQLYIQEICAFLTSARAGTYDLLIAADVFAYIGELEATFAAAYRASTSNALFCFSVEDLPGNTELLRLQSSGRFAHSRSYIENSASFCGWVIRCSEKVDLRLEGEGRIQGRIYTMRKKASS